MNFLAPFFLIGALAAAVPVVLHLLKRQPEERVRFSAVHLSLIHISEPTRPY